MHGGVGVSTVRRRVTGKDFEVVDTRRLRNGRPLEQVSQCLAKRIERGGGYPGSDLPAVDPMEDAVEVYEALIKPFKECKE